MAQTTVEFKGKQYPFYRTNRGMFDYGNAGYTTGLMEQGRVDALLAFIYYQLRDCARRAGLDFEYSFDEFIDESPEGVLGVYGALNQAEAAEAAKASKKAPKGEAPEG